jgi:hypothetical protein
MPDFAGFKFQWLQHIMTSHGLTHAEAAGMIRVSAASITRWTKKGYPEQSAEACEALLVELRKRGLNKW